MENLENSRIDRDALDGIFSQSNVSVPLTSLVVDHFLARAEDEITGTSPYFEFKPQGMADVDAAEEFNRYFSLEIGRQRVVSEKD